MTSLQPLADPGQAWGSACEQVTAGLFQFIDNELAVPERLATRRHLDACPPCALEHRIRLLLKGLVKEACLAPAPQGLRERVTASLNGAVA